MAAPDGKAFMEHFVPGASDFTLGLGVALVDGGAAGDFTVTGITPGAELKFVGHFTTKDAIATLGDLTSEFTVTAKNTINNAGGTATTDDQLFIIYVNRFDG